jgi:hypothetical protein
MFGTPAFNKAPWTPCNIDVIGPICKEIKFFIQRLVYTHHITSNSCGVGF